MNKPIIKHYNLAIPLELYDEVEKTAEENAVSVVSLFRKFIQIGLMILRLQEEENSTFVIRNNEDKSEREILIIF